MKIASVSNKDDYIIFTFLKDKNFYAFLHALLKFFEIKNMPDLDDNGGYDDASKEFDEAFSWESKNISIISIVGCKKIFLTVFTKQRDKLTKFIEKNTEFVSSVKIIK